VVAIRTDRVEARALRIAVAVAFDVEGVQEILVNYAFPPTESRRFYEFSYGKRPINQDRLGTNKAKVPKGCVSAPVLAAEELRGVGDRLVEAVTWNAIRERPNTGHDSVEFLRDTPFF
jgi:hypothetical protein